MMRVLIRKCTSLVITINFLLVTPFLYAQQYDAVLQWSKRATLGTLSSGVIAGVPVDAGDRAKQGELLLQLDQQLFERRVKQSQLAVKSADENFQEARREKERAEELYNRTVLSDHDLQLAKNNEVHARAQLEQAKLQLEKARYDLKYSRITAPFNLLVLERHAQPGQVVSAELQPPVLLVVAASDIMRARIAVNEAALATVKMGQSATIEVVNTKYTGKVVAIGFEPVARKDSTISYPVDIEFATGDQVLRAGLSAKVELP